MVSKTGTMMRIDDTSNLEHDEDRFITKSKSESIHMYTDTHIIGARQK